MEIIKTEGQSAYTIKLPVTVGGFNFLKFEVSGVTEHDAVRNLSLALNVAIGFVDAYVPVAPAQVDAPVEAPADATPAADAPVDTVPATDAPAI